MKNDFPTFIQDNIYECGLICIKIISKYYKKEFNQFDYRGFIDKNKKGISIYDLIYIAENENYIAHSFYCDIDAVKKISFPVIVLIDHHYLVLYKYKNSKFYISDPKKGLYSLSTSLFSKIFLDNNGLGKVITIFPNWGVYNKKLGSSYFDTFRFIFSYIFQYKRDTTQVFIIMFIISIIYGILPFISRSVIDLGINNRDFEFVYLISIATIFLHVFKSIGEWIKTSVSTYLSNKIKISIITDYTSKVFKLPMSFFNQSTLGDIIQKANDQDRIQGYIANSLLSIVLSILILFIYSNILFYFDITLFFIFFVSSIIHMVLTISFHNIRKKMDGNYFSLQAENQSLWIESLKNIEDIKINNYSNIQRRKWEKIHKDMFNISIKSMHIERFQKFGSDLLNSIKEVSITLYGAYLVINGQISFGTLISIQFIIGQLNTPIIEIINFIKSSQSAFISFNRIKDILNTENEQKIYSGIISHFNNLKNNSISFNNVNFKYDKDSLYILKNINFTIPSNKKIVIVGKSGSGKTTILKLISKIHSNYSGSIYFGESNIKRFENEFWRDQIGCVFQESKLYKGSILDNIIMNDSQNFNEDKLKFSIKWSNLENELMKLPGGINMNIKENEVGLSQGQKQRIIIARAIYKNPRVLLLDESTNALDPYSENVILSYINEHCKNKTVIIASHKLSTIRIADEIIVMDGGHIIERGSFHDLIETKRSFFYNLFKDQL